MINIPLNFRTPEQREFFELRCRNQDFSGGFGNGKTYAGCQKIVYLASTFPGYRAAIVRFEESKLRETTMKTFFNPDICPPALYAPENGGLRADSMNRLQFINGSEIIWMHLKDVDQGMVRGLEVNSILIDQAEEISETMFTLLNARVGRWKRARVPEELLAAKPDWPTDKHGQHIIPSYMMILNNPDSELHWIYRRFHPESEEYQQKRFKTYKMIQGATTSETVDPEVLAEMMENDPSWVDRFVFGKWGIPGGQIHTVLDSSILRVGKDVSIDFVKTIIEKGNRIRVLDHGDSSPTCCLWFTAYKQWYFCYREYYKPNALISEHRTNISALSGNEHYFRNLIDPQCAKKTLQKYGGTWTHIDEYADPKIEAPPIYWEPADNNELSTRNRISELLQINLSIKHPVTQQQGAPKLYFIERSPEYPNGCYHAIQQIKSQKREKVGQINGKDIFSDDRAEGVTDHAYDPIRYYVASHSSGLSEPRRTVPKGSFLDLRKQIILLRKSGYYEQFQRAG